VLPSLERRFLESVKIIVDGGARRGTDVVKALALGARACMIGRPYLYGLAVAGEAGVGHVLRTLVVEVRRAMALLGATTLTALTPDHVRRLDAVNC
jgi:L-lactate dehydrogenase (cytochrome)